jgi:hypothetical protein
LQDRQEQIAAGLVPRPMQTLPVPEDPPSELERREHELTHLPARRWCLTCMPAKSDECSHPSALRPGRSHECRSALHVSEVRCYTNGSG